MLIISDKLDLKKLKIPKIKLTKKLEKEIKTISFLEDPQTEQRFEIRKVNWPEDNNLKEIVPVIDTLPPGIDITHPTVVFALGQLALFHRKPIILINQLGSGQSSKLNEKQHRALRQGNLSAITDPLLGAIKKEGISEINAIGYSMGGQIAASVAAEAANFGIKVKKLLIGDPSGGVEFSYGQLLKIFLKEISDDDLVYIDSDGDLKIDNSLIKKGQALFFLFYRPLKDFRTNLISYSNAARKLTLISDIKKVLLMQSNLEVRLVVASHSLICPVSVKHEIRYLFKRKNIKSQYKSVEIKKSAHAIGLNSTALMWLSANLLKD